MYLWKLPQTGGTQGHSLQGCHRRAGARSRTFLRVRAWRDGFASRFVSLRACAAGSCLARGFSECPPKVTWTKSGKCWVPDPCTKFRCSTVAQIIQGYIRRQCCFSCIPDTLVFLLWIPDFAPGPRPGPEMSVDFDQTVADFFIKKNLYLSLACARALETGYSWNFDKIK